MQYSGRQKAMEHHQASLLHDEEWHCVKEQAYVGHQPQDEERQAAREVPADSLVPSPPPWHNDTR